MVKKTERPRSWRGYLINNSALPWPDDVTEEQKQEWRKEFEEKINGVVSGAVTVQDEVDIIIRNILATARVEMRRALNALQHESPDDLERLKGAYYTKDIKVLVNLGDMESRFPLQISIQQT